MVAVDPNLILQRIRSGTLMQVSEPMQLSAFVMHVYKRWYTFHVKGITLQTKAEYLDEWMHEW